MILPNIIPTKGTKIVSLNFRRDRSVINNSEPRKDTSTAIVVFSSIEAPGKNRIASKTPRRALSIVPDVVGDTKRFRLSCCITKPQILNDAPAIKILTKRGTRLSRKICHWLSLKWSNPCKLTVLMPRKREIAESKTNRKTKYRRLNILKWEWFVTERG